MANELSIVSTVNDQDGKRYHVFDKREGQTVGALVSRDHPTPESAVEWCCANYGLKPSDFGQR